MTKRIAVLLSASLLLAACGGSTTPATDAHDKIDVAAGDAVGDLAEVHPQECIGNECGPPECVPQCVDEVGYVMECGPDGCGGSCGECMDEAQCVDAGYGVSKCFAPEDCPEICATTEAPMECGPFAPFFDGDEEIVCDCGPCPDGQVCVQEEFGVCCTPECGDDGCGDDGCGGLCECPPEVECLERDYTPEVGPEGICFDPDFFCPPTCKDLECGEVTVFITAEGGADCECGDCTGEQDECIENKCVCQPDCEGKECGEDGCGGDCGKCATGYVCDVGQCVIGPEEAWVTITGGDFDGGQVTFTSTKEALYIFKDEDLQVVMAEGQYQLEVHLGGIDEGVVGQFTSDLPNPVSPWIWFNDGSALPEGTLWKYEAVAFQVTVDQFDPPDGRVIGLFSGTLEDLTGGPQIELTDGYFNVPRLQ